MLYFGIVIIVTVIFLKNVKVTQLNKLSLLLTRVQYNFKKNGGRYLYLSICINTHTHTYITYICVCI